MTNSEKATEFVGQTLAGRYYLETLIGEGGFGAVFRARDLVGGDVYAVKILYLDDQITDAQRVKGLQYFQREVGTLSRVQHPGIVSIFDGGLTQHRIPYLVMELAEGELLSKILRWEGRLSLLRVARIFSQLCAAVAAIHKRGIIHRDLKPDNIVVRCDAEGAETIKVLDFGLAKLVRGEGDEKWLRTLTGRGQVHGTLYYMSPEQCEYRKLDERTDIYSLGVIAYELLAGRPPFRATSPVGLMMHHLESAPPPLRAICPDLPVEAEIAILRALEKDRAKRYANALDFSERIEQIAADCATAQLKAGGDPNAQFESAARTQVIPIDERRLTTEVDRSKFRTAPKSVDEKQPTNRMSRIRDLFNKPRKK